MADTPFGSEGFARYRLLSIAHDFTMASLAFCAAFLLRYGLAGLGPEQMTIMSYGAPSFGLMVAILSTRLGLHKHLWSYTTSDDLLRVIAAVTGATVVVFLTFFLTSRLDGVPRSVPLILAALTLIMLAGSRFAVRLASGPHAVAGFEPVSDSLRVPVMLVGVSPRTEMFLRWTKRIRFVPHHVVAVLDLEGGAEGGTLHGVPIVGPGNQLEKIIAWLADHDQKPSWMILCDGFDAEVMSELTRVACQSDIKVARMPSLMTLDDDISAPQLPLKSIAIEDLLGRSQVKLDLDELGELIGSRRVLVTGGGGTIGGELCRQIVRYQPSVLCILDNCEYNLYAIEQDLRAHLGEQTADPVGGGIRIVPLLTDIRDRATLFHHIDRLKPELVFHAAALKHVPMIEANPIEAIRTNVFGTRNVADAAKRCGAMGMVTVSTDKVVNPSSVMGATKWLAEQYCLDRDRHAGDWGTRFIVVRFGNVLGSSGSVVPLFRKQLAEGGPLTVTHPDITRYFMTVREAVQLTLQAAAHSLENGEDRGNVLVLDMGKPIKVYDLACHMIRLAGLEPGKDIEIKSIGLRPGEKLFEELFATNETQLPAKIGGVNIASSAPPGERELERTLERLERLLPMQRPDAAIAELESIVVGFDERPGKPRPKKVTMDRASTGEARERKAEQEPADQKAKVVAA